MWWKKNGRKRANKVFLVIIRSIPPFWLDGVEHSVLTYISTKVGASTGRGEGLQGVRPSIVYKRTVKYCTFSKFPLCVKRVLWVFLQKKHIFFFHQPFIVDEKDVRLSLPGLAFGKKLNYAIYETKRVQVWPMVYSFVVGFCYAAPYRLNLAMQKSVDYVLQFCWQTCSSNKGEIESELMYIHTP